MQGSPTHYDTLGVAPDATAEEIRDAYRNLSSSGNPETIAQINAAYDVLSDSERRREYDHQLAEQRVARGEKPAIQPPHRHHHQGNGSQRPGDEPTKEEKAAALELLARFWHAAVGVIVFVAWLVYTYVECKAGHGVGISCGHRWNWH